MAKIEQENRSHGRVPKRSMKNSVPSFESSGSPVLLFSSTPLIPPATPFTPVALIVSRSSPSYPPVTPATLVQYSILDKKKKAPPRWAALYLFSYKARAHCSDAWTKCCKGKCLRTRRSRCSGCRPKHRRTNRLPLFPGK